MEAREELPYIPCRTLKETCEGDRVKKLHCPAKHPPVCWDNLCICDPRYP